MCVMKVKIMKEDREKEVSINAEIKASEEADTTAFSTTYLA